MSRQNALAILGLITERIRSAAAPAGRELENPATSLSVNGRLYVLFSDTMRLNPREAT
jgi:hypothetical protein